MFRKIRRILCGKTNCFSIENRENESGALYGAVISCYIKWKWSRKEAEKCKSWRKASI